jgi:hypothetical protein
MPEPFTVLSQLAMVKRRRDDVKLPECIRSARLELSTGHTGAFFYLVCVMPNNLNYNAHETTLTQLHSSEDPKRKNKKTCSFK